MIENIQIKEDLKESNNKLSLLMKENIQIKEDLKESNNMLSLMMKKFQSFMDEMNDRNENLRKEMNELKGNQDINENLRNEMDGNLMKPLKCFRCNEKFDLMNNSRCRYHDGTYEQEALYSTELDEFWTCCNNFYFKLKEGHSRHSLHDLMRNENDDLIPDHSTGCKQHDCHESN